MKWTNENRKDETNPRLKKSHEKALLEAKKKALWSKNLKRFVTIPEN